MIPALFSVSYAGFWGQAQQSLPIFLRKAKELGYEAVEVMGKRPHLSILDYSLQDVADLKKQLDELGLQATTIAAYTNFTGGQESPEVPIVEVQLAYIKRLAEFAEVLGTDLIRIFTGYFSDKLSYTAQWNLCVDAVREASEIAANHGVTIGVQNHHDIGVGVEAYEDFLNAVGHQNCRAMFDAWSIVMQEDVDLYAWARRLAPKMVQTTVADYVKHPRYRLMGDVSAYERIMPDAVLAVPLGEGFIDYEAFFRGLREGGFDGVVAYEMCWPLRGGGAIANLDATARKSLAYIQRLTSRPG